MTTRLTALRSFAAMLALGGALGGCNAIDRLGSLGEQPRLNPIENPQAQPGYRPVSLPMPAPIVAERQPNSLWRAGSRAFFKDQRAGRVGDILTVIISLNERAQIQNNTTRGRTSSEVNNLNNLFGYQADIRKFLPGAVTTGNNNPGNILDLNNTSNAAGTAQIQRQEQITLRVAALVTQVLPNGNLVIQGKQEMRINFEVRVLDIAGVIRPEDISAQNTISYDQIAEARVGYGGRGQLTDVQQPRYGNQLLDIIMPF